MGVAVKVSEKSGEGVAVSKPGNKICPLQAVS